MRILFLGTPEFAVPSLRALIDSSKLEIVGLVTQPDRPAGRGKKLLAPPTKILAQEHGIPVLQPERLSKAPDIVQAMKDLKPDLLVTVAFGQILKKEVLNMAGHGVMNLHASLLPKYRGAAPINWAIINGDEVGGLCTMFSDEGVDTGKVLLKKELMISPELDAVSLAEKMSKVGAELLLASIDCLIEGSLNPEEQDETQASYAPRLSKELGLIDWSKSSKDIHNLVRGLKPWPGTYTHYNGQMIKIVSCKPHPAASVQEFDSAEPGTIVSTESPFLLACGDSGRQRLELLEIQPESKAKMSPESWARGLRLKSGAKFNS